MITRERTTRELRVEAGPDAPGGTRAYRVIEAWRGDSGHGLCYFLALPAGEAGDPDAADDRHDRRAVLAPDEELADADEDRLRELHERARPLTDTERRFSGPDGKWWLAQNTGPVWAEAGVAEGATGILFTSLEGTLERGRVPGGHVANLTGSELVAARDRALAPPDAPDES